MSLVLAAEMLTYLRLTSRCRCGVRHAYLQLHFWCAQKRVVLLQGGKSRVDFVLETKGGGDMYVEVKSVTLAETLEAAGVTGGRQ
jgi:hypothetical protein